MAAPNRMSRSIDSHPRSHTTHPQTNAASAVPDNAGAVRGNINSVIFFESVVGGTRVRYVCEVEPKGWLPTVVRGLGRVVHNSHFNSAVTEASSSSPACTIQHIDRRWRRRRTTCRACWA